MKNKQWLIFSYFILPVLVMMIIFGLSSQPVLPGPDIFWQDFVFKKLAHMSVFALLFWSWFFAFRQLEIKTGQNFNFKWWMILLLCLFFAFSDEWHQSFVPGRTATLRDVGFDFLGSSLACLWSYRLL